MREKFKIHRVFVEEAFKLCDEERLQFYKALVEYGINGIRTEYNLPEYIYKTIDRDNDKNGRQCKDYKEWRLKVFQRDNFRCAICGKVGGRLNAHHIKHYSTHPLLRYEVSNGITLCEICHREVHRNERKK